MIEIRLTQGLRAVVDDQDAGQARFRWFAHRGGSKHQNVYAARWILSPRRRLVLMHRALLGAPDGLEVDHRNGDTLDNRRQNLRLATRSQQMWNMRSRGGSSVFVGVSWYPKLRKWVAKIGHDARQRHIGYFDSEIEAARARDRAAFELHGAFARLNFPRAYAQAH